MYMRYVNVIELNKLDYKVCNKCSGVNDSGNDLCVYCSKSGLFKPITDKYIQQLKKVYVEVKV